MEQFFYWIGGIIVLIIGYFLNRTMEDLDKVKEQSIDNKSKIDLVANNHSHLNDKFDLLYDAVKDLTKEIKNLNVALSKKKDI